MKFTAACLSALLVMCFSSGAGAGPLADAAGRAEAFQAEGKTVEALEALSDAVDAVWTEAPLAFRKVVLSESSAGYGEYIERSDRVFRPDEEMHIYMEPVGFGYGGSGASTTIDLSFDLEIENTTGQVMGESRDIFKFSQKTYPKRRDISIALTIGAPYLRPGDYKFAFTARDQNSHKTATFEVPFTLTFPAAADTANSGAGGAPPPGETAGGNGASDTPLSGEAGASVPDPAQESASDAGQSGAADMQGSEAGADQNSDQAGGASQAPAMESQGSPEEAAAEPGAVSDDSTDAPAQPPGSNGSGGGETKTQ